MHGYMLKLGNPFLTQWQKRYFYLFPNRLEWRGEGESRVSPGLGPAQPWGVCSSSLILLYIQLSPSVTETRVAVSKLSPFLE